MSLDVDAIQTRTEYDSDVMTAHDTDLDGLLSLLELLGLEAAAAAGV